MWKIPKMDQCEWELPQMCQEHNRHTHSSIGRRCVGCKGSKNQDSLPLQLFYYMSQSERVFHLNSQFLMNGQTSCKPSRPEALILPTVRFLDGLPYFMHLCLASPLWTCQRGVERSLGIIRFSHGACVLKLACLHPLSKCVWSFVEQGEVREETPPALLQRLVYCLSCNWGGRKRDLIFLISCRFVIEGAPI